jgi:hypothetical protein
MKAPSLGFKPGKAHGYLEHFAQEKFLREGHNTVAPLPPRSLVRVNENPTQPANATQRVDVVGGQTPPAPAPVMSKVFPVPSTPTLAPGFQTPSPVAAAIGKVVPGARQPLAARRPDALSRAAVRRAVRHVVPGALSVTDANRARGLAVAAERPVIAAKVAARAAGLGRQATRAAVRVARADPNSRRSERQAARAARRTNTAGGY